MKILLFSGLFLLVLTKTVSGQNSTSNENSTYSTVLNSFLKQEKTKKRKIVLEKESDNEFELSTNVYWDSIIIKYSEKLIDINKEKITFDNNLKLKDFKLIIVSRQEINILFKDDINKGWTDFYKKYRKTGGIVKMSKMYLKPDSTQGLIYISITRAGLSGAGYIIYFDLADKKIIKAKQGIWVS